MKNENVKRLATLGLLTALIVVLQALGGGIHIGPLSISLVLIPIVIGAAVYGPGAGAILGAVFGIMVAIGCINGTDAGGAMVFAANPFLCIVVVLGKGIAAGAGAGWIYKLIAPKNSYVAMLCAAILCPILNTGLFLLAMFTIFAEVLQGWAGDGNMFLYALTGIVVANFLPELAINILISPASQRIIHQVTRK